LTSALDGSRLSASLPGGFTACLLEKGYFVIPNVKQNMVLKDSKIIPTKLLLQPYI
jgi:hypothetical protein